MLSFLSNHSRFGRFLFGSDPCCCSLGFRPKLCHRFRLTAPPFFIRKLRKWRNFSKRELVEICENREWSYIFGTLSNQKEFWPGLANLITGMAFQKIVCLDWHLLRYHRISLPAPANGHPEQEWWLGVPRATWLSDWAYWPSSKPC